MPPCRLSTSRPSRAARSTAANPCARRWGRRNTHTQPRGWCQYPAHVRLFSLWRTPFVRILTDANVGRRHTQSAFINSSDEEDDGTTPGVFVSAMRLQPATPPRVRGCGLEISITPSPCALVWHAGVGRCAPSGSRRCTGRRSGRRGRRPAAVRVGRSPSQRRRLLPNCGRTVVRTARISSDCGSLRSLVKEWPERARGMGGPPSLILGGHSIADSMWLAPCSSAVRVSSTTTFCVAPRPGWFSAMLLEKVTPPGPRMVYLRTGPPPAAIAAISAAGWICVALV